MNELTLLGRVCDAYRAILGDKLTGFYVHGSVAFGCFTWATGDLDFLVVVSKPLTQAEKEALVRILLDLSPDAPPKGFEMSVVLREHCRPFRYPTPFELHFSGAHKARAEKDLPAFCRNMHGDDPDLAAHITVLHHVGFPLYGPPVGEVFSAVPRKCYVDSILADVSGAQEESAANPVYFTLNLCRVLAFLTDSSVLSKAQGGAWGLTHLPQTYHLLLTAALSSYRTGEPLPDPAQTGSFAAMMLRRIRALL